MLTQLEINKYPNKYPILFFYLETLWSSANMLGLCYWLTHDYIPAPECSISAWPCI